ncbi:ATP-binding protein [Hydrogenovibrio marinus]|uniref:histidine kinase n=1 Tax=Hydrogenovibrio marinus TaxID=28885 RepID=A0A067A0X2_HYDMR|nr:ATP-binding protein [Hydrogenovibrio marinus]KDN96020.1 hypothetical protein EI16_06960 [Hydrogenovibrio marinus]BBN58483.1 hypothetical protein HVMH_0077 [Hydrogenovibrio marinus]
MSPFTLFSHTAKNRLLALLILFVLGFFAQTIINYSIENFINALDKHIQNADVQRVVTSDISLEIRNIESLFYQMAAFPNKHMRNIILRKISEKESKVYESFFILNNGGNFYHSYDLNLPDADKLESFQTYQPERFNHFSFAAADILPKFRLINEKLVELNDQLEEIDKLQQEKSPLLSRKITEFQLNMKFFTPIFHRLKESANRVFLTNALDYKKLKQRVQKDKERYRNYQILLSISLIVIGLWIFWHLSRSINQSISELTESRDYSRNILESQSNIIIINDGEKLIDASGGFFAFFEDYDSLDAFQHEHECVCDFFVKEEGFIYKFPDKKWIEYLVDHPHQTHKVKVLHKGEISLFQISAMKSKLYDRFVISMFDISENERINEHLMIEKDKALAATKAKGEFLANMSHEIRTPLNAILGFIALLKEKNQDKESREYLDIIDTSSQALTSIINDILDLSKIESGKLEIDPVVFDPQKSISQVADLFLARCSEKNIDLIINIDRMPPRLEADVLRINQILSNFLSNAVKFSDAGQSITLTASYDWDKEQLLCKVMDEGIGIPLEKQADIFESFSQAESSTTRKYGGTGLGLTISAKLIQLLGGDLQLKSEESKGSCFGFTVPAKIVKMATEIERKQTLQDSFEGHILLVEDNVTNQMLMSAILKKLELTFDIAQDGLEAVDRVQESRYDLILMDENMPKLNGINATKQIRMLEKANQIIPQVVVALTANAMKGDKERFLMAGMDNYLPKPINIDDLKSVLMEYLPSNQNEV